MKKLSRMKAIAAAAGACAALASGSAQAFVYAASHLDVQNLGIFIDASTTVNSFTFNLSNSASMNGGPSASSAACNSFGAPPCSLISPVLDAAEVNAAGSSLLRTNNNFAFLGTNQVNSYSGADSVVNNAALVQGVPTAIEQIAESLLNANGFAQANALIQSNTSLSWTLTVGQSGAFFLRFDADPDQSSEINGLLGSYLSQSDMNVSMTLSQSGGGGTVNWAPQGTAANDCVATGTLAGVTCTEFADTQDLNRNTSTSTNPGSDNNSFEAAAALTAFGIDIIGLPAGTYTLALNAQTSTSIIRNVPEPTSLALLGLALAGAGLSMSRRRQASK